METVYDSEEKICSVYRENPSKFMEDILKVHNRYRAIHNSPPLQIDEKVANSSRIVFISDVKYLFENSIESAFFFSNLGTRAIFSNSITRRCIISRETLQRRDDYYIQNNTTIVLSI